MKKLDLDKLHEMESEARDIAQVIGGVLDKAHGPKKVGFCLMIFSFDGEELTYISSAQREDMIKLLKEFRQRLIQGTDNDLANPYGKGPRH